LESGFKFAHVSDAPPPVLLEERPVQPVADVFPAKLDGAGGLPNQRKLLALVVAHHPRLRAPVKKTSNTGKNEHHRQPDQQRPA